MNKSVTLRLFTVLPTCILSRIAGAAARVPFPQPIMKAFISWYSKRYGVSEEYEVPPQGFRTFDEFFTRRLKKGARTVARAPLAVVSPVDGRIQRYGAIEDTTLIQAKGITYTLDDLIPSPTAALFRGGSFMTLYLAPGDYHRIHAPVDGTITGYFNIPGRLFTVQEWMVARQPLLYARNERIITYIAAEAGTVAVCKIGAFNVGRITLAYCDERTNRMFRTRRERFFPSGDGVPVKAGDEIGAFHLGSSIILLFQNNAVRFNQIPYETTVRMGASIGTLRRR